MSHRVLLAGLFHETHTFLEGTTRLADFEIRRGEELWLAENDGSPLAGALGIARQENWNVVPVIDLRATPGPTVEDEVVELFWNELSAAADSALASGLDGVYLVLHGAMASESVLDVEGELLERLRQKLGPYIPIGGVLDLHGNCTQKMTSNSQAFVAYRQNPHADAYAAARDGALLLQRLMSTGERPTTVWVRPPIMWPPTGTGTAFDPLRTLESMARHIEEVHDEILAVNVFAGFSFADTPDTGVSFSAVTLGEPRYALAELEALADWAVDHRHLGMVREDPWETVLAKIKALPCPSGPIVIAEPSDNIGGGAPGDGIELLKHFLNADLQNAAVAINAPQAVAALSDASPGERRRLSLGNANSKFGTGALEADFEFVSRNSGRFQLEDLQSHLASMCGSHFDMGPCAVVRLQGVTVLLTSQKTPPFDLGQWRSQGIEPTKLAIIGVKAAVAHRRVYDPIAACHFAVETTGPCSSHLAAFPFQHVRRPVYPLDE